MPLKPPILQANVQGRVLHHIASAFLPLALYVRFWHLFTVSAVCFTLERQSCGSHRFWYQGGMMLGERWAFWGEGWGNIGGEDELLLVGDQSVDM
eukprot:9178456-Ditylum_brightwellii.AAC.1